MQHAGAACCTHPGDELLAVGVVEVAAKAAELGEHLHCARVGRALQVAPDQAL